MDSFPVCQVCHQQFTLKSPSPYLLPCLHAVCETCVTSSAGGVTSCCTCLKDTNLTETHLQKDVVRQREIFHLTVQHRPSELLCTHEDDGNQAVCWCQECEEFLYEHCQNMHESFKATGSHSVQDVGDIQPGGLYHEDGVPEDRLVDDTKMDQKVEAKDKIYLVRGRKRDIQNGNTEEHGSRGITGQHHILKLESSFAEEITALKTKLESQTRSFTLEKQKLTDQLAVEQRDKNRVEQQLDDERKVIGNLKEEVRQLKETLKSLEKNLTTTELTLEVQQTSNATLTIEKKKAETEAEEAQKEFINQLHETESLRVEVSELKQKADCARKDLAKSNTKVNELHASIINMAKLKGEAERKVKETTMRCQAAEAEVMRLKIPGITLIENNQNNME